MRTTNLSHNYCNKIPQRLCSRQKVTPLLSSLARTGRHFSSSSCTLTTTTKDLNTANIATTATTTMRKPFHTIPGPRQYPFVGNTLEVAPRIDDLYALHQEWHQKYGDIVRYNLAGEDNVLLFDPEDIALVHRTENSHNRPANPIWQHYKKRRGGMKNLLEVDPFDESWRSQKRAMSPLLHMENVGKFIIPTIAQVANDLVHCIRANIVDHKSCHVDSFHDIIYRFALEGAVSVLYDKRLGLLDTNGDSISEDSKGLINAIVGMLSTTTDLMFGVPYWKLFDTPLLKKHFGHWDEIYRLTNKFFQDYLKNRKEHSMVELIIEQCKKENYSQHEVDTINSSMLAGAVDTTGIQLKWVLYHLAHDQVRQEKLYQEIKTVLGSNAPKDAIITNAQLKQMTYLKDVVKESLRLNSIIINTQRVFDTDLEIKGYHIPAKTPINIGSWVSAKSSKYFHDALEFKPERYKEGSDPKISSFAHNSFGFGVRMCAGRRLAETEMYMSIAKLVQNFVIKMDSNHMPVPQFRLLIAPGVEGKKDFNLQFHERS